MCEYSKLMQLFEIFEYLFNRDQPGDWRATCFYFASHKLLHSPDAEPSAVPSVFLPLPGSHSPDHARTHARSPVFAQTQRMVSWALALLSVFLWIQL